jgi:hypothetical protein
MFAPDTATYSNRSLGISFTHPSDWQVSTTGRESRILMPIPDSEERAELHIFAADFRDEPDIWQTTQVRINEQLGRQVVRQWQEEILGVPFLLTRIQFVEKEVPKVSLTGLVYSATPSKLLFRLTASPVNFEKAEFEWRQALQSLRTLSGAIPAAEDPNRPPEERRPTTGSTRSVTFREEKRDPSEFVKAPVVVEVTAAGRELELRLPQGWAADREPECKVLVLRHPDLRAPVKLLVASSLDSDAAIRALFKASDESLQQFTSVSRREEPNPRVNRAGARLMQIWRTGRSRDGDLFTGDAAGATGDFYWLLSYRAESKDQLNRDRRLIESLIDAMSVEVKE